MLPCLMMGRIESQSLTEGFGGFLCSVLVLQNDTQVIVAGGIVGFEFQCFSKFLQSFLYSSLLK